MWLTRFLFKIFLFFPCLWLLFVFLWEWLTKHGDHEVISFFTTRRGMFWCASHVLGFRHDRTKPRQKVITQQLFVCRTLSVYFHVWGRQTRVPHTHMVTYKHGMRVLRERSVLLRNASTRFVSWPHAVRRKFWENASMCKRKVSEKKLRTTQSLVGKKMRASFCLVHCTIVCEKRVVLNGWFA